MTTVLLAAGSTPAPIVPASGTGQLIAAALIGIAVIVLLITRFKVHPFLSLTIGSLVVGAVATMPMADTVTSFSNGVGSTVASVGLLIALGAMFGRLLADSGGADQIVDTIVGRAGVRTLPWAMALVGALIGLPMFFEIGLVLLMPVILLVSVRSGLSLMRVGIPALAGLSAMHGLVPPHPGPLIAIAAVKANLGVTLGLGVLIAIPTIIIAGPLFSKFAARWVDVQAPASFMTEREAALVGAGSGTAGPGRLTESTTGATTIGGGTGGIDDAGTGTTGRRPSFGVTLLTVLLPVVLMMAKALVDIFASKGDTLYTVLDFIGTPLIALLIAVVVAMFTFGRGSGMDTRGIAGSLEKSLPPIAGIVLIVAAGGGFKQTLIDTGIGKVIADAVKGSSISVLLLAWLVAVLIRVATGSATVATVTASGVLAPLASGLSTSHVSLLVLAIGSGSLFFSHVNDAGFWLVKEYFGVSVVQNLKTWSAMETLLSVTGLVLVLAVGLVV
ncbi:MAG: gluconate:H+ symporter, GntP family [Blastococcus sp.]|jgi:GntP family gluconate:H+ symporter|nr:gluconate:H+ symporter, GntP family [Blastococcus sp.]